MMRLNKLQLFLMIGISVLIGYFFGLNKVQFDWKSYKPRLTVINREPPAQLGAIDMSQFWSVWDKLNQLYYDKSKLDTTKMVNGAVSGMVNALGDPFTLYLPPAQNNNFQQQLAGKFEGIGAELGTKDNQVIVIAPLDGSPAQKAGIQAGDIILKVDNQRIDNLNLAQVVDKIRGPKGTTVKLTVLHKGAQSTNDISIIRNTITVKSVYGWVKQVKDVDVVNICHSGSNQTSPADCTKNIMYVRLSQFGDNTNQDWLALINSLISKDGNPKGMILDLRNNPGGYLDDANFIAGEFLPQGTTVVKQDDGKGNVTAMSVSRNGKLLTIPLVVIVNGGSASASEIVTGALRDNKRASVVGDQTFGKGTIQQSLDMGGGAGLHVTIAKWLTPNGAWVHNKGIKPNVVISLDPKDPSHDTQLEAAIKELLK